MGPSRTEIEDPQNFYMCPSKSRHTANLEKLRSTQHRSLFLFVLLLLLLILFHMLVCGLFRLVIFGLAGFLWVLLLLRRLGLGTTCFLVGAGLDVPENCKLSAGGFENAKVQTRLLARVL